MKYFQYNTLVLPWCLLKCRVNLSECTQMLWSVVCSHVQFSRRIKRLSFCCDTDVRTLCSRRARKETWSASASRSCAIKRRRERSLKTISKRWVAPAIDALMFVLWSVLLSAVTLTPQPRACRRSCECLSWQNGSLNGCLISVWYLWIISWWYLFFALPGIFLSQVCW